VARATEQGTHLGDYMGIPPTGKCIKVSWIAIYRVADGKLAEHWQHIPRFSRGIFLSESKAELRRRSAGPRAFYAPDMTSRDNCLPGLRGLELANVNLKQRSA
jgi:hypothetical protein